MWDPYFVISQHTDGLDEHGRVHDELFKLRKLWRIVVPDKLWTKLINDGM
jgi:hypothetical protein